jgi:PAS domain S-box-containing protein
MSLPGAERGRPAHAVVVPDPSRVRSLHDVLSDQAILAIVEGAPDGMVMVDGEGRILLVNRRIEEMFGYDRDELVGKPVEALIPERVRDVHVVHRDRYAAAPRIREMGSGLELTGRRRDGTELPIEVSLSPIVTDDVRHSLAIVRDVTQRKEAEGALRRLQRLLDTSREAVFLLHSESFEFVYVNEGAAGLTCYPRRELLGMTPARLAPALDLEEFRELVAPLLAGTQETAETQTTLRRADGTDVECDVLLQHFEWAERSWIAAFCRDISDRLRAQEEQMRAEHALTLVNEQERIARDLHDTVIQSLFGIGMSIQAAATLVPDDRIRERLGKAVDDLDRAIRSLRTTVFELHSPSPMSTGLRDEVTTIAHDISRSLGFTPAVHFLGPVDLTVTNEVRDQLVPCLREALGNVARHAHARSVQIDLSVGDEVSLRVTDDGVGLPPDVPRGHGLSNLEQRARSLGGVCEVSPRPGGGTIVDWRVPLPSLTEQPSPR